MKILAKTVVQTFDKIVDYNYNNFIQKIENITGLQVDSAYRKIYRDNFIVLWDRYGNEYEAEITKYSDGEYELHAYNISQITTIY